MIGTTLNDRYQIEVELGQGGMGTVYRAHDLRLKRDVAVKILTATRLGTEGRQRLMNEAQAAARLNHPNIVSVYDAGEAKLPEDDSVPFVVMELLEGPTLHQQPPANQGRAIALARQLCAALDHAHGQGVVHRDLKPENVMLVSGGQTVKLMDFGLARSVASRLTGEGAILGTLFYLSPEMIRGEEVDGRADLYALGIMLYEWTTGRLPFEAADPVAVLTQHLHAPVVPPSTRQPDLRPGLETVILQLLAKDPGRRLASAARVLEALEGLETESAARRQTRETSLLERIARGRLAGRQAEVAQTREVWAQTRGGQGQLLLISGEPGIGKSRLAREVVTQAVAGGGLALEGAAYAEGNLPYGPFRQILRQALTSMQRAGPVMSAQDLSNLLALVPELRSTVPEAGGKQTTLADLAQGRLLEEMVLLLSLLSQQGPLLVLLEDMHWADSGSLTMLRHLARNTRHLPLLLLVTYREVEIGPAGVFHRLLLDFDREQLGRRIKLSRLDRQGTEAMLAILFDEQITPDFLEGIYAETEGNPFFIEEVCKALIDSGKLAFQDGRWRRPPMAELGVPQSIQVAVQARVQALSAEAQPILELAAVLGRNFAYRTLLMASEAAEEEVIDALEEAGAAQIIEESDGLESGGYAFVHALIPAALVSGMRTLHRRRLHRQAAAALEKLQPEGFEALAHHFVEGAQMSKGVEYLLKAGDRARLLYAHQEAIESYENALEHLREQGQSDRMAGLLMKLGQVYHSAFQYDQSRRAYEEGFEQMRKSAAAKSQDSLPPAPHALRMSWTEPQSLDPGLTLDNADVSIADQLFSGLVEITPELDVAPDLARRWQVLDGGRRYRFHLREDAIWSDGRPVTAEDFVFGLEQRLDPDLELLETPLFYDIKGAEGLHQGLVSDPNALGVRALSDRILEIELDQPTAYFLQIAAYIRPLPRHVVETLGPAWALPANIVTCGPFLLEEWRPGSFLRLRRNPGYRGRFPGNVEQVELLFYLDADQRRDAYASDKLDLRFFVADEAVRIRRMSTNEYVVLQILGTRYLGFNLQRPPLDDRRVRQALAMALDREYLASVVMDDQVTPATGGVVPPGMAGHVPGIALPFDPAAARQLLAEAGYQDGRGLGRLVMQLPHSDSAHPDTALIQQWRENLGIEVSVERLAWEEFMRQPVEARRDMWTMTWTPYYPDPDDFLRLSTLSRTSGTGWHHERYAYLLEEGRRLADHDRRLALYEEAQRIIAAEVPTLPLHYPRGHCLVKPWIRRTSASPLRLWHFKEVIIEPH